MYNLYDCSIPTVPNELREFTEADLGNMTEDFSNVIGRGSFGCVYKGIYEHTPVAVKVINPVGFFCTHNYNYYDNAILMTTLTCRRSCKTLAIKHSRLSCILLPSMC